MSQDLIDKLLEDERLQKYPILLVLEVLLIISKVWEEENESIKS